jgi:hypothetical protein
MLRAPDGGTRLERSRRTRPDRQPGSPAARANEFGVRNVAFEVDDLTAAVDQLAVDGYELVGLRARSGGDHRALGPADRLTCFQRPRPDRGSGIGGRRCGSLRAWPMA